ncbi:MAG TPA: MFS transporter, partial [Ktedonobacteraceae bacterium]|nr:MFS transporter [Ktedonobacteraceae bacterium]
AMGRYQATEGITLLIGPFLAGILYSIANVLPFFMDAISYIVSAVSLCFIATSFQKERRTATPQHIGADIMEGLVWLWRQPLILFLAVLSGGVNVFLASFPLIVIVLAQQQHASPFTIGLIFAIGGCGGIAGALLGGVIKKRFRFGQVIGGILWSWVVFWALYLVVSNLIVLGLIATVFFFSEPVYNVVQFSHRLSLIPDHLQGRVNSAFRLIAFSGPPLGLALTGMLLQTIHVQPTILVFLGILMSLALVTTLSPHMQMNPESSRTMPSQ